MIFADEFNMYGYWQVANSTFQLFYQLQQRLKKENEITVQYSSLKSEGDINKIEHKSRFIIVGGVIITDDVCRLDGSRLKKDTTYK